jgi:transcriptional regulator with XRE-family HTH domain
MFEELFYDRLIKLRTEKKVSAREMSLDIGQSPGYINGLENRNGFPSMQLFFYICEYLGVTPSEFFDEGNNHPIEYRELLKDLDTLSEENRRNVLAIVKGLKH